MRAIVFDTELSSLIFEDEINTLRLCYLIADSICVGGQAGSTFYFEKDAKEYNIKKKVLYLICSENASNNPNKELIINTLVLLLLDIKTMKATKHPSMDRLNPYNNAVRNFIKYYNTQFDNFIDYWKKCGYLDIISLKDEEKIIESTLLEFSVGDWSQTLKAAPINAKKILSELFPKAPPEPSLLVFPKEFLIVKDADNQTEDYKIISTFSFTDTDFLTPIQLKAIREQLKVSGKLFRTNVDEWLQTFYNTDITLDYKYPNSNQLEESFQTFQSSINTNEILTNNHEKIGNVAEKYCIQIGIASIQKILELLSSM